MEKLAHKRAELVAERTAAYKLLKQNIKESTTAAILGLVSTGIAELSKKEVLELEEVHKETPQIDYLIKGLTILKEIV